MMLRSSELFCSFFTVCSKLVDLNRLVFIKKVYLANNYCNTFFIFFAILKLIIAPPRRVILAGPLRWWGKLPLPRDMHLALFFFFLDKSSQHCLKKMQELCKLQPKTSGLVEEFRRVWKLGTCVMLHEGTHWFKCLLERVACFSC